MRDATTPGICFANLGRASRKKVGHDLGYVRNHKEMVVNRRQRCNTPCKATCRSDEVNLCLKDWSCATNYGGAIKSKHAGRYSGSYQLLSSAYRENSNQSSLQFSTWQASLDLKCDKWPAKDTYKPAGLLSEFICITSRRRTISSGRR